MLKPRHVRIGAILFAPLLGLFGLFELTHAILVHDVNGLVILDTISSFASALLLTLVLILTRKSPDKQAETWQEYWDGK